MVQVRVCQDDGVNRRGIDGQRRPVAQPQFLQTLKQTTVDQNPPAIHLEQMLRTGDSACRA